MITIKPSNDYMEHLSLLSSLASKQSKWESYYNSNICIGDKIAQRGVGGEMQKIDVQQGDAPEPALSTR